MLRHRFSVRRPNKNHHVNVLKSEPLEDRMLLACNVTVLAASDFTTSEDRPQQVLVGSQDISGTDATLQLSPDTYNVTTKETGFGRATYGTFTVTPTCDVSATSGALTAIGSEISLDKTKLAAVTILGDEQFNTALGRAQVTSVSGVARAGDLWQRDVTVFVPAFSYNVNTLPTGFVTATYGSFTVADDGSGILGVSGTSGALIATGNDISMDSTKLAAVTILATQFETSEGRDQQTQVGGVVNVTGADDTVFLPAQTYRVQTNATGFGSGVYGTITVADDGFGTLAVSGTSGALLATGNTIGPDMTNLSAVAPVAAIPGGLQTTEGHNQIVSVAGVVNVSSGAHTVFLPAVRYLVTTAATGFGSGVYGTITVADDGSGTLAVTETTGAVVTTGDTFDILPCELHQVRVEYDGGWQISGVRFSAAGTDTVSLPSGSYRIVEQANILADFTVGPGGLSHGALPTGLGLVLTTCNQPPSSEAGGPYDVAEGGMVQLDASGTTDDQQDLGTLTYEWDLDGDGVFGETGAAAERGDEVGIMPTYSAVGVDGPSTQTVYLRATDDEGLSTTDSTTIDVANVARTITSISVPVDPVDINDQSSFSVDVTFTDPAGADDETYTCRFDMESDGTNDVTVTGVTGTSCSATLAYSEPGVYSVTVTVEDKDEGISGAASTTEFLVIYDPDGGFVTGGGWIDSPAGACSFEDCTDETTGKAHFGFVSKYKNGASVPTGNTQFQFQAGDLNFHSSSYDWLVIAGAKAMYKGEGTINGSGNYSFQINAIDGQVNGDGGLDKFRIKIKDSGGGVIYDNNRGAGDNDDPTTELGGGSINIHNQNNLTVDAASDPRTGGASASRSMLDEAMTGAIAYWASQGVAPAELRALEQLDVRLADLDGAVLATASVTDNTVWIDLDAAGFGWSTITSAAPSSHTEGVDLLSAVVHELGHVLGWDHDALGSTLAVGQRHLPIVDPVPGDANRDGVFDRFDLIELLQRGKYLTGEPALWSEGDWNGDARFDQLDLVEALQSGNYRGDAEFDEVFAGLDR